MTTKKKPTEPAVTMSWPQQSPIDLGKSLYTPDLPVLAFNYDNVTLSGDFKGDNFVIDLPETHKCSPSTNPPPQVATICFDGIRCPLVKVHFHSPSEHSIDTVPAIFEAHLVHKVPTFPEAYPSGYIVVAVFYDYPTQKSKKRATKAKTLEDVVVRQFFSAAGKGKHTIKPSVFIPDHPNEFYRYEGSLTTPPYSENVSWIVLKEHNSLDTADEIAVESDALEPARDLQPVNRRFVLRNFQ